MKIRLYNEIAPQGLELLPRSWEVGADLTEEDAVLVRSADLHEAPLSPALRAVARAGAGVNNIPVDECTGKGVAVFNTPGANAESVKELALAGIFLISRDVLGGMEWAQTLSGDGEAAKKVEKEKSRFQGPEVLGKTLGIIGLGAVGGKLANAAAALGMRVLGFDPFLSVAAALELSPEVTVVRDRDEIFRESDYISVHVPSVPATRGLLGGDNLKKCKKGVRLLNLSRADLAVEADILEGLGSGRIAAYFTDFPTPGLAGQKGVVATPHLGASTPEAEEHCAVMACRELRDFLLYGNVSCSVNFPELSLPRGDGHRTAVLFRPEAAQRVSRYFSGARMAQNARGGAAYLLAETEGPVDTASLMREEGVIRVTTF